MSDGTAAKPVEAADTPTTTTPASPEDGGGLRPPVISLDLLPFVVVSGTTDVLRTTLAAFGVDIEAFPVAVPRPTGRAGPRPAFQHAGILPS